MIVAVELEEDGTLIPPITRWSHRPRDGDWTAGYDELVRAAGAFARGVSFLTRHWDELEPKLLTAIESHPQHGPRLAMLRRADRWLDATIMQTLL